MKHNKTLFKNYKGRYLPILNQAGRISSYTKRDRLTGRFVSIDANDDNEKTT